MSDRLVYAAGAAGSLLPLGLYLLGRRMMTSWRRAARHNAFIHLGTLRLENAARRE